MTGEISRQTFLRGAVGALAAGAFVGSGRAGGVPIASGWDGLSIGGQVIRPDSPQFGSAKAVFNTNYNGMTPAAVVVPTSSADVQKAMTFAAANNLKVAPRGGGHSYVGASTANGTMVLDLRQLPGDVNYDAGTGLVTVTPATSLYAMHQVLAAAGRGIPTGTCPSVGAAGHALGGGLGAHSRHAGLMSDALRSATVVLPSGQAVTASANSQPDLFWALRGGGGGNFGVTTSLTFATFPATEVDAVNLNFPAQSFAQVLVGWQNWLRTADRSCWALADATVDPDGHALPHLGDLSGWIGWQRRVRHHRGCRPPAHRDGQPYVQLLGSDELSWPRAISILHLSDMSAAQTFSRRSHRQPHRGSPRRSTRSLAEPVACWPSCTRSTELWPMCPQGRRPSRGDGSRHWCSGMSKHRGIRRVRSAGWAAAHRAVQPYSVGGYANYLEANQPVSRYFGPNLAQLSAVRQKYDPGRVMFSGLPV